MYVCLCWGEAMRQVAHVEVAPASLCTTTNVRCHALPPVSASAQHLHLVTATKGALLAASYEPLRADGCPGWIISNCFAVNASAVQALPKSVPSALHSFSSTDLAQVQLPETTAAIKEHAGKMSSSWSSCRPDAIGGADFETYCWAHTVSHRDPGFTGFFRSVNLKYTSCNRKPYVLHCLLHTEFL